MESIAMKETDDGAQIHNLVFTKRLHQGGYATFYMHIQDAIIDLQEDGSTKDVKYSSLYRF